MLNSFFAEAKRFLSGSGSLEVGGGRLGVGLEVTTFSLLLKGLVLVYPPIIRLDL